MKTISQMGEKRLIAEIIRPLFNPTSSPDSVGDDCAVVGTIDEGVTAICISTDRVPADLLSFKWGLIDFYQLGYYLAILNISDLAAAGARPCGLLLNLGLPKNFLVRDLQSLLNGALAASKLHNCPIIGGDLSDASELNLVGVSLGKLEGPSRLYRSGARPGHAIFCCDTIGVTPTAFSYFGKLRGKANLSESDEDLLALPFRRPEARIMCGDALRRSGACSAVMDNTDGVGQCLSELSDASNMAMVIHSEALPLLPITASVAKLIRTDTINLALGPGADFQLIGTIDLCHAGYQASSLGLKIIGHVEDGHGVWIDRPDGERRPVTIQGWNYYTDTH